ncbi:hypothetical protein PAL_GLEAN10015254 [Pteropus alecto]|uniref:von Willebrand factor A domain-containing protein 8 n=1 Tax=Pteropus alecto TaxID=9402 RepID=L5KFB9_PTEAL|nr:hypothetical protein PAL_GLEAN10015254 [Pteropus alecto]
MPWASDLSASLLLPARKYDIVGHSGDDYNIDLVPINRIPKDNKQRLEVLKTMHAHAQFCMSGDHTLDGTQHAIQDIVKEEADEYFVIVLRREPNHHTMHAHAQFCMSGDHTLDGTQHAIQDIVKEEADEYFVIVLSDANLSRYGIHPAEFAQILTHNPQVNAFAIFIGSLGDQATSLQRTLPAGRSFVAMDTKDIPQILQQIFTSTMLSGV